MQKRKFLQFFALSSAGPVLTGCATQGTVFNDVFAPPAPKTSSLNKAPLSADEIASAAQAKALINGASGGSTEADLREAGMQWKQQLQPFLASKHIALDQAGPLALATAKMLRLMDMGYDQLDNAKQGRATATRTQVNGTVVTVPPRSTVEFSQRGYCLDVSLPAPSSREKFVLRKVDQLIPEPLLPVYRGLYALAKEDRDVRRTMQYLVWALREAGTQGKHAKAVSKRHLDMMARAYPDGDRVFMQYHMQELEKTANPLGDVLRALTTVKNRRGQEFNLIDGFRNAESNDPQHAQGLADNTLNEVTNGTVPGAIPEDDSDYTMLAPGIAAQTVGKTLLTPSITITNTTDRPFEFDTKDYYAESQRQTQRVGLGAPDSVSERPRMGPSKEFLDQFKADGIRSVRDLILDNLHRQVQDLLLGRTFAGKVINKSLAPMLSAVPILGNLLSLSNLITGKDWATGEPLGCVAQGLAAIGTIPGAGLFLQLAGGNRAGMIAQLAQSAYTQRLITSVQRTQMVRELTSWLSSGTARQAYNYALPQGEISSRISEVMTGGCQRNWGG